MATLVSDLLAYVETKTQAGTGTLNSSLGLGYLNEALNDYTTELIKRGVDAAQIQEAYATATVPTTGNGSTFAYPSDMFALKTIEVNMTDNNQNNYILAQQVDVSNLPGNYSFSQLRVNQPTSAPMFDDRGDTYEIFPSFGSATNLTNAIRIFYYLAPTPYTTLGDTLVYPVTLDWYILALRVASLYFQALQKFNEADFWEGKYTARIAKNITTLAKGSQQPIEPTPLQITGWEF